MDYTDKLIKNILSENITQSPQYEKTIRNFTLNKKYIQSKTKYGLYKQLVTICTCIILISAGAVYSQNISQFINNIFGNTSEGINTAIENGYILEPQMEYIQSNGTDVKITDLLMDDENLTFITSFVFQEDINIEDIHTIRLPNLIITDEQNRILFCQNQEAFYNYCLKNNLDFEYNEFNENYINTGYNSFITSTDINTNSTNLVFNIFGNTFPNSEKLIFNFETINITNKNQSLETILTGNWTVELDMPSIFSQRQATVYTMKSSNEETLKVSKAVILNTSMKLEFTIQKEKVYNENDSKEVRKEKMNEKSFKLMDARSLARSKGNDDDFDIFAPTEYIENKDGRKFYPSKENSESGGYSDDYQNGIVSYWQTFNLTKYDNAGNNLKVYLKYNTDGYGDWKDIVIELEKQD